MRLAKFTINTRPLKVLLLLVQWLVPMTIFATNQAYAAEDSDFQLTFKLEKESYGLDEPIRFIVSDANQPFFLYLFSIDRFNENVEMVLPHERQPINIYGPHQTNLVPDENFEFYSSSPGKEELLMITSPDYIPELKMGVVNVTALLKTQDIELKRSLGIADAAMKSVLVHRFNLLIRNR